MDKKQQKQNREEALERFRIQCRWYAEALEQWERMHIDGQLDPDMRKPELPTFPVGSFPF
jgi:hypothetical protein